jgi:hypothetical protein
MRQLIDLSFMSRRAKRNWRTDTNQNEIRGSHDDKYEDG